MILGDKCTQNQWYFVRICLDCRVSLGGFELTKWPDRWMFNGDLSMPMMNMMTLSSYEEYNNNDNKIMILYDTTSVVSFYDFGLLLCGVSY